MHLAWFKRDLRVYDHAALAEAARRGTGLPLFIAEPGYRSKPDASGRHRAFIAECLDELRTDGSWGLTTTLARIASPAVGVPASRHSKPSCANAAKRITARCRIL